MLCFLLLAANQAAAAGLFFPLLGCCVAAAHPLPGTFGAVLASAGPLHFHGFVPSFLDIGMLHIPSLKPLYHGFTCCAMQGCGTGFGMRRRVVFSAGSAVRLSSFLGAAGCRESIFYALCVSSVKSYGVVWYT